MESITQVHNITPEHLVERLSMNLSGSLAKGNVVKPVWKYITRKEAAKVLDVTYMTLDSWDRRGILKKRKIGNRVYYKLDELESLLENNN